MIATLKSIFSITATQTGNQFIYFLKRIPIIKKIIPDSVYADTSLKIVLCNLIEAFRYLMKFFSKALYIFLAVFIPLAIYQSGNETVIRYELINLAVQILIGMSFFAGALQEPMLFKRDAQKITCVRLLHMSARKYILAQIWLDAIVTFVTFLPSIVIPSMLLGLPFYKGILLTFMIVVFRLLGSCVHQAIYKKTGQIIYMKFWWAAIEYLPALAIAYLPLFYGFSLDYSKYLLGIGGWIGSILLLLFAVFYLKKYPYYHRGVIDCLKDKYIMSDVKQATREAQFASVQLKEKDFSGENVFRSQKVSRLKGYELLNAIFFERHRRLLIKPIFYRLAAVWIAFVAGIVMINVSPKLSMELAQKLTSMLNIFIFIMYAISIGDRMSKALFFNCDISLLRYGFYREKGVILKNFGIRMRKAIALNLLPAMAICFALAGLLLISGTSINWTEIVPFLLSILLLSVFFSVHHMFLYYVFQPYTTELDVKNPFFKMINGAVYMACFVCLQIDAVPAGFVWGVLAATMLYIIAAFILVFKFAPKMFKVK